MKRSGIIEILRAEMEVANRTAKRYNDDRYLSTSLKAEAQAYQHVIDLLTDDKYAKVFKELI